MYLVLVRHGESLWNQENRFTGWTDVPLTEQGKKEAKHAGILLKRTGISFEMAYTSVLKRAVDTLSIIKETLGEEILTIENWHLNERHYGALQGLNKDETRQKYGEKQVQLWRRSFEVTPPTLSKADDRYPGNDPKYKDLTEEELPLTESLKDTMNRAVSYFLQEIRPQIVSGKDVLIVAHGNSLRAIRMYLEKISAEEIPHLEIPLGIPLIYEMDENCHIIKQYDLGK